MYNIKIIADTIFGNTSFSPRATTFELEYPRYIHAELLTHRVLSRNSASSRAIPITKMIEQATHNTVMPIWTNNQSGMQGAVITHGRTIQKANEVMLNMLSAVAAGVELLSELGVHKQNANRYLEPFQHIKTVLTGTDFENFFALRFHKDAQPEIAQLATEMYAHYKRSKPRKAAGSTHNVEAWHLPYAEGISELKEAQAVSASCCAQVSYRTQDTSLDKALVIYDKLVKSKPAHYSPFEHQCMLRPDNKLQKGNLRDLYQYRQFIEEGELSPFLPC